MHISLGARHDFVRRYGVPEGWRSCTLADLSRVVGGGTPSRGEDRFWRGGAIPWATPSDITANKTKYLSETAECITEAGLASSAAVLLPQGSILYTSRATIGAKAIAGAPVSTNQGFASLLPKLIDGEYLYYLLDLLTPMIKRLGSGTTFDEVSKRDLRTVWCAVPMDPEEQRAVVSILGAVDTAIELSHAAVERARQLSSSVLEDAFEKLQAPSLQLREFTTDVRYGTSKASSARGWGDPVLRIPNVVGDKLSLADLAFVELQSSDIERLRLRDGDLLLVRTNGNPNYVGRSAVFRRPDNRTWVYASYLIRVRLSDGLIPEFVNVYLGLERGRRELLRRVTTSAGNHNINSNSIRLLRLPAPKDKSAQVRIVELADALRSHVDALRARAEALEMLKKSLVDDLLTGRVRVRSRVEVPTS